MKRLLLLALALLSPSAHAEWLERVEDGIMGTRIVVELWADDTAQGNAAIEAVLAEMRRVDAAMSTYKPTSELSMVNARAAKEPVKISAELFDLLSTALDYSRLTDGAFDITYESVGYLYDFRARTHPSDGEIAIAMGMTETKFHETYDNLRGAAIVHLDDLRSELADPSASGTANADKQRLKSALMQALKVLDEREQIVLACYYGDGLTLREIGAILEVTESRVCQLHTQALTTLRNRLG